MSFWHELPLPIIGLAPMDGVTDLVFRHVVGTHGKPDVIFTEFTNVADICRRQEVGTDTLQYTEPERPIVAQIYGKDPQLFYQAAHVVCELGFDGLDINMGCPSKNVASSGCGAGLIRTPALALSIMESTRQGIRDWANGQTLMEAGLKSKLIEKVKRMNLQRDGLPEPMVRHRIPLSVKTRLGYDSVIIEEWVDCLLQGCPEVVSIHGRTLTQMYRGQADWEAIARASTRIHAKGTLFLGNGDVGSLNEAAQRIRDTSVNGVLIGRAALGNPWIFRRIADLRRMLSTGGTQAIGEFPVELPHRFQMMIEHARLFEDIKGTEKFPRMRKHLGWYCSGFPHAAAMRAQMVRTNSVNDVETIVKTYQAAQSRYVSPTVVSGSAHS